jgi:hypothetical protein
MQKDQTCSKIIDFYNLSHGSVNGYPKINPLYFMQIEVFQLLSLLKIQLSYLELQKSFGKKCAWLNQIPSHIMQKGTRMQPLGRGYKKQKH